MQSVPSGGPASVRLHPIRFQSGANEADVSWLARMHSSLRRFTLKKRLSATYNVSIWSAAAVETTLVQLRRSTFESRKARVNPGGGAHEGRDRLGWYQRGNWRFR